MVRVIRLADDGTEVAAIEVDDFTIEVLYSGIAKMLQDAALPSAAAETVPDALSTRGPPAPREDLEPDPGLTAAGGSPWGRDPAPVVGGGRKGAPLR